MDIPARGWRIRTWTNDIRTARVYRANVSVSPGNHLNAICIHVYVTDYSETDGVMGWLNGANRKNPGDYLQLFATGARKVMSSVNPLGVRHNNMVRAKGGVPRGLMFL